MTKNIYYNGKVKAAEYLLEQFLLALRDCKNQIRSKHIPHHLNSLLDISPPSEDNIHDFLNSAYPHYKHLADYDIWMAIKNIYLDATDCPAKKFASRLMERKLPKVCTITASTLCMAEHIAAELRHETKLEEWQLGIISLPTKTYDNKKKQILLKMPDQKVKYVGFDSSPIGAISDQTELTSFLRIDIEVDDTLVKKIKSAFVESGCINVACQGDDHNKQA